MGRSSSIVCSADVPIIQINRGTDEDSFYIEIRDMALSFSAMSTTNSFHIEAENPLRLIIYGVYFYALERQYSGVLTWNGSSRTEPINGGPSLSAFMTHIENCLFSHGSIWLNDSDSRIINNYIWANSDVNNLDYAIRLSNKTVNVSGNDIVPGKHSGIYLASTTCNGVRIENNYFDGSWNGVNTGWGIYISEATHCLIIGNCFNNVYKGGIYSSLAHQLIISHNQFTELNRSGSSSTCYDVRINGSSSQLSTGHIIEGNVHKRMFSGTKSYAVHIGSYAQASIVNNSLVDWGDSVSYRKPPFVIVNHGKYSLRKDNRVNDVSGTYPFQFDEGSVVVQNSIYPQYVEVHFASDFSAQNIVPRIQDIHINFIGASATSAVVFSIYDVTVSSFKISFRPVCYKTLVDNQLVCTDSTTDGTFFWRVSLQ